MSDHRLLVRASRLYYELGETQERIAEILGVTRPHVSRLLKEARDLGVVEIRVIDDAGDDGSTARTLRERFDLRDVLLSPRLAGPVDLTRRSIGRLAARALRAVLRDGLVIGVGRGRSVAAAVDALSGSIRPVAATVVPLSGAGGSFPSDDPVRRLAEAIGATGHEIAAPGIVGDPAVRDALVRHPAIEPVVRLWGRLDLAIFGIGVHQATPWLPADVIAATERAAPVGEVLLAPVGEDGRFVSDPLRERVIAFDARDLPRVPVTIAVAGGDDKVRPILGALRAGGVRVLVTDLETARSVLKLDGTSRHSRPDRGGPRHTGTPLPTVRAVLT
jgi:DNA-binding transcriptional regulator LsrR (DeoR family)